ncbi:MAG: glycosyltransferase family 2 protein, partial [Bacteroidota bacterium]
YRRRIGVSKITGTVRGTLGASYKILATIGKYAVR